MVSNQCPVCLDLFNTEKDMTQGNREREQHYWHHKLQGIPLREGIPTYRGYPLVNGVTEVDIDRLYQLKDSEK